MRAHLVTIFWRDIPAQVNAQSGRTRRQVVLDRRFQVAIDKAAMVAGLHDVHGYVQQWRRVARPCGDDLAMEAATAASVLESAYPRTRLQRIVLAGGIDPDS